MSNLRDIYLFFPYYISESFERQQEIDRCLHNNLNVEQIKKIYLLIDDGSKPNIDSDKIEIIYLEKRPTYLDWVNYTQKLVTKGISVLANSDIYFDATIVDLNTIFNKVDKAFVTLSRYEIQGKQSTLHPNPHWSQDVWCIDAEKPLSTELKKSLDISLGVPRCDNKISYLFSVNGYQVFNPCRFIKSYHVHETQVRSYSAHTDKRILGGTAWVYASESLLTPSKLVYDVWSLSDSAGVERVKINNTILEKEKNQKIMKQELQDQKIKDPSFIVAYDDQWQYPAITEQHAYEMLKKWVNLKQDNSITYLAFPWATLLDNLLHNKKDPHKQAYLKNKLLSLKGRFKNSKKVITTCQHIHMLKFQDLFEEMGVTDIFWSHATRGQEALPSYPHIKVHAFPLYPVQAANIVKIRREKKKVRYSFIGAKANQYYLTESRNILLEELKNDKSAIVRGNDTWHYNKIVYDHQIKNTATQKENLIDVDLSKKFIELLETSVFSLCPSGTGPNSIRLWESIGLGAIPVILADSLQLPGDPKLWEQAAVFCKEDRESIKKLPNILQALHANSEKLQDMRHAMQQLWDMYGAQYFVYDIAKLIMSSVQNHLVNNDEVKDNVVVHKNSKEVTLMINEILLDTDKFIQRLKHNRKDIELSLAKSNIEQRKLFERSLRIKQLEAKWKGGV